MSITKFRCTVPGKVIIAGEHAVVFGHPALACTIALRTIANLELLDNNDIRLQMKTVNMNLLFNVDSLDSEVVERLVFTDESVHDDFEIICGEIIPDLLSKEQRMSLSTSGIIVLNIFLYLLFGICGKKTHHGINLTVDGEFPLASGLGSSASVSVAIAAIMYGFSKQSVDIGSGEKKILNEWSLRCEQFTHGKASGLDNYAVVYGGLTEAKSGTFKTIPYKSERLEVMLIDSGIPKSTKSAVANVKQYHADFPNVVKGVFDSIGGVTNHIIVRHFMYQRIIFISLLFRNFWSQKRPICLKFIDYSTLIIVY